ncbi:MAG: asparagine synthase (glutamine-hydrolyzing) [bacterium]|nr:asparagine synthase (glutamine-hydrolyzing) [bacterium]
MCGISGIYSRQSNIDKAIIKSMNDCIAHRGPDDEGFLAYSTETKKAYELNSNAFSDFRENANLFLGHRRLSIIDTSNAGHEPFVDPTSKYFMIFNGEIYNYIELREDLIKKGYKFHSKTDTEVLLYLYIEYKEKCLGYLNGMWSFVILDTERNILFGSRDRFGVKPFYYFLDNNYFLFASEIKALLKAPQINRSINAKAAFDFLAGGRMLEPDITMFEKIFELESSHYFTVDLNNNFFEKKRYYELTYTDKFEKFDETRSKHYIEEIREKIINAIRLRLRSDVAIGSCLSGGIDSSSIVCVINYLMKDQKIEQVGDLQKVFTASFPGTLIDETNWAELVVKETSTDWHRTYPDSKSLLGDLEKLVYVQDVPFGSTSIYSQYRVMKLASENKVKVLLDGQGGDELFTGYTYFIRSFYNELIKHRDFSSVMNEYKSTTNSPFDKKAINKMFGKSFANLFLPSAVKKKLINFIEPENLLIEKNFYDNNFERLKEGKLREFTNLNSSLHNQFTISSLRELLKYEDRNSMNFSIEARTPFADDINLIEYVFNIPGSYKMRNGWTKYLMRESMKGIVPEKILTRTDKVGFATPEYYWLNDIKDNLKEYFTKDLNEYIKIDKIVGDWDSIFAGQKKTGITNLWRFINFAMWKKVYNV